MKSKCSFTLKALTALVLAVVMLFGTVATTIAATIETADTGAQAEVAATGFNTGSSVTIYYDNSSSGWSNVFFRIGHGSYASEYSMTQVGTTSLYYYNINSSWNGYDGFNFAAKSGQTGSIWNKSGNNTEQTAHKKFALSNGTYYFKGTGSNEWLACEGAAGGSSESNSSDYTTYSKTVTRSAVTNGNISISYINTSRNSATLASGNTSSNITALIGTPITVTAAPSSGYYTYQLNATNSSVTSNNRSNTLTTNLTGNSTTTVSADIRLPKYYLGGLGSSWTTVEMVSQGDGWYKASKSLKGNAATTYSAETANYFGYKIVDEQNNTYYRYGTTITSTKTKSSPVTMVSTSGNNSAITTVNTGNSTDNYIFYYKPSTHQLAVYYPANITVTKSPNKGTVKFGSSTVASTKYIQNNANQAVTVTAPTGYTVSSVSGANWARTANEATTTEWTGTIHSDVNATLAVTFAEIKDSAIALTAYTNGEASTTGGTIQVGGSTVTSIPAGDVGIDTGVTAVSVASNATYALSGWQFSGTKYNKIKYSFDNSTWNTPAAADTTYGGPSNTTIYIKTDGTSGLTTADAIVKAMFVTGNRDVTTTALLAIDGTGYKSSNSFTTDPTLTGEDSYAAVGDPDDVTLTASEPAGYKFVGWYVSDNGSLTSAELNSAVQGTSGIYTYTAGTRTLSFTMNTSCDLHYYALYKKIYYITVYNSYDEPEEDDFRFRTSPPRTITATHTSGATTTTTTFTYSAGNITQRGEDNYENGNGTGPNANTGATPHIVSSGTFYEGNKIAVLAGDTVVMTYSTLSSSDVISGVFFNNDIRFTTELEYDNLYTGRVYQGYHYDDDEKENVGNGTDDSWNYTYQSGTTLFADPRYYANEYVEDTETLITSVIAGQTYKATVNQDAHTVTFTADQDYLNIDLELGEKRRIFFSDTDDIVIHSVHTDDFYSIGEELSNTPESSVLYVKAAGSTSQVNKIKYSEIKVYQADAKGNPIGDPIEMVSGVINHSGGELNIAKNVSSDVISSTEAGAASTYYIYLYGKMPEYNVYVDLGLTAECKMYIGSKIVSDTIANKSYLADEVATITATYTSPSSTSHTAPNNALYNSTAKTATKGVDVKYTITFSGSWGNYYMFNGWYTGDSTGPDFANGFLTKDTTMYYKPTKNMYIYAVGTRDVFINGSKYIIGKNNDYNAENGYKNLRMEFESDYVNPDGNARGRYYWTITPDMLTAASGQFTFTNNSNPGNSFFKLYDTENNGDANNHYLWNTVADFYNETGTNGCHFGKDATTGGDGFGTYNGLGWIRFKESDFPGWSSPITIYYYPGHGISVSATPVWPSIYLSNGYKNIDEANPNNHAVTYTINGAAATSSNSSSANTWTTLSCESTVRTVKIKVKNATVKFTKEVASASYKVSYFFAYNLSTDEVKAYAAKDEGSNKYSAEIKMNNDENLYVCPIIEYKDADMTVIFDASDMDYSQWGKFVSCYAWYSGSSGDAYGAYPGQLMVPYDGGQTWKCTFPSTKTGGSAEIVGITFANYLDGSNTWLGGSGVLGSVSGTASANVEHGLSTSGGLITTYNSVGDHAYHKMNCKTQTYDYREPIAFYENSDVDDTILTFAIKPGNDLLITKNYNTLTTTNKGGISSFEYLVDQKGRYVDLNGYSLSDKPAASFYVAAKGMVTYTDNTMLRMFGDANTYQKQGDSGAWTSAITYTDAHGAASGVSMKYAVQWFIYDASGNYITNVLSAGYADKSDDDITSNGKSVAAARTQIAKALDDMGYATSGRSVMICYDQARYCYGEGGSPSVPNGGSTFDAYRFEGQWVQQNQYDTATVSVLVGLSTANGFEMEETSEADCGSATVVVDKSKLDHKSLPEGDYEKQIGAELDNGVWTGTVTITDGDKGGVILSADSTNFKGWYYYNDKDEEWVLASEEETYAPGVSKDITYYAVFESKATYKLNYYGRQGASKNYSVSGGYLTSEEIGNSNTVSTSRTDFDTSFGQGIISIFKKTLNISTHSALDNNTPRVLQATLSGVTPETFTLTYYYPDSQGGSSVVHSTSGIAYNTVANLPSEVTSVVRSSTPSGQVFVGWYDYTGNVQGELLSTYMNYGYRMVKDQTIIAVYGDAPYSNDGSGWTVKIDDHAITRELTSVGKGTFYNDTIIRVRNGADMSGNTAIPAGSEVGILLVKDGGNADWATNTRTVAQLTNYVNSASLTNGKTAKINANGATVTKLCLSGDSLSTLTMYNRSDFAYYGDYASLKGQKYTVYVYAKINGTCYFSNGTDSITSVSDTFN